MYILYKFIIGSIEYILVVDIGVDSNLLIEVNTVLSIINMNKIMTINLVNINNFIFGKVNISFEANVVM